MVMFMNLYLCILVVIFWSGETCVHNNLRVLNNVGKSLVVPASHHQPLRRMVYVYILFIPLDR